MLDCPSSAQTNITIPKEKFYQAGNVVHKVKRLFVDDIEKIILRAVIAPRTMNITGEIYDELHILEIRLKGREVGHKVLETIDSVIPRPVLFMIVRANGDTKYAISYKEANAKNANKSRVVQYYETAWNVAAPKISGNSVKHIYINLIWQIEPTFDPTKPLAEAVQYTKEIVKIKAAIDKLNSHIKAEPSIAKRQQLARQRYKLEQELH